jgi:hypothetical protein
MAILFRMTTSDVRSDAVVVAAVADPGSSRRSVTNVTKV